MKQALIPLVFFAQFKRPLTLKQIRRYTWGREFEMNELKQILKKSRIKQVGEYYCLDESHLMESAYRYQQAEKFWKQVKRYLWVFSNVPFLRLVTISNTLAYDYVKKTSDIDLFATTAKNRVWTARAWLLLWLSIFGIRAKGKHKRMRFSPEMLVDETALDLSTCAWASDYLMYYYIVDMVPIWGVERFNQFWSANRWINQKLPVAYRSQNRREEFDKKIKSSWLVWLLEKILGGRFGDMVEIRARRIQQRNIDRAKRKLGDDDVIADNHVVETHFRGRRLEIRDKIEEFLSKDEKETVTV